EASLLANPVSDQTGFEGRIRNLTGSIVDEGGFVLVQGPRGAVRVVAGNPSSATMPPPPPAGVKNAIGTLKTSDGSRYVYIEPNANATGGFKFVFAMPDNSIEQALSDLLRTLLIVVIVLLLVGLPIAWLLARSVTGPMRRLAGAARDLPTAAGEIEPLPLEGPNEVTALTERFNAMAHELASTRHEETQLLANLRHDLRTPLTSIAGFAEAIADGTASGDRATAAARTIAEEAQRLERLVGELGVVERLRQGSASLRPEALDATVLLTDAAARFEARAGGMGVSLEAAPAIPGEPALTFTGDKLAAERILQNLVENAVSVVPRGGHIWLRATSLRMPGRPPGIALSVTDDGPGFPPGTSERVFERFYRADPSRTGSGSGLGLAIVRELARAHGGEAWAENVAPHGARVTVLLPLTPAIPGLTDAPAAAPTPAPESEA
ncbi:MAG: HAMP domain-containing sensor histidine kinase, partial [Candidatus Limnocylindrales bacterium]